MPEGGGRGPDVAVGLFFGRTRGSDVGLTNLCRLIGGGTGGWTLLGIGWFDGGMSLIALYANQADPANEKMK